MSSTTRSNGTRVGVYVDAFNVYYRGRALCGRGAPGWRWLDLAGLAMDLINPRLWPDPTITTVAYCTALRDRKGDPSSLIDQRTYIGALVHHSPMLSVIEGKYTVRVDSGVLVDAKAKPPRRVISPGKALLPPWLPADEVAGASGQTELLVSVATFEEKGSDVNVATKLLYDVIGGAVDAAMVFSNDSDLSLPLAEARRYVPVATINPGPNRTAADLRGDTNSGAGRHWWRKLRQEDFYSHQLPDPVGPYTKPIGW